MNAGDVLEPLTFTVTRADLVAYAEASGDHNPIHQDEEVARSVGLPGVIAHGMYTLALVVAMMSAPPIWRRPVTVRVALSSSPTASGRE